MICPRCQSPLEAVNLGGQDFFTCGACTGALVGQRQLVPLLGYIAGELADDLDPDHPIEAVLGHAGQAVCPGCSKPMQAAGYMESKLVTIDRCSACAVVWTDPEELGVMALLWARTNRRSTTRQEEWDEYQRGLSRRISAMLLARTAGGGLL